MKKFLCTILSLFLTLGVAFGVSGCDKFPSECNKLCANLFDKCTQEDEYVDDSFFVTIKAEYKNVFLEKAFTVDDFRSEYIENIQYIAWFDKEQPERGCLTIKLKERYKNKLEQVMQNVATLSFVTDVEKIGVIRIPETF